MLVACGFTGFALPVNHIYKTSYKCKHLTEAALNTKRNTFLVTKHDSF